MGSNSSQEAQAITKSISTNIVNSIQSLNSNNTVVSEINLTCKAATDAGGVRQNCVEDCFTASTNGHWSAYDTGSVCSAVCGCTVKNVNMSQALVIASKTQQNSTVNQAIEASATTALDQYAKNSATHQSATNISDLITQNVAEIQQSIGLNNSAFNIINSDSSYVSGITMGQSINAVSDYIQSNTDIQKNINSIATTITQSSVNTINWIMYAGIGIILIFIIIFAILLLSKSKDLKDFFHRIMPILVWFIIVTLVTVIHVLVKPSYVSYIMPGDTTQTKNIDVAKLLMWMFIYYVGFAFLVYGFFKFTRRKEDDEGDYKLPDDDDDDKSGINIHISGGRKPTVVHSGNRNDEGKHDEDDKLFT
jgi:hypothetical protein